MAALTTGYRGLILLMLVIWRSGVTLLDFPMSHLWISRTLRIVSNRERNEESLILFHESLRITRITLESRLSWLMLTTRESCRVAHNRDVKTVSVVSDPKIKQPKIWLLPTRWTGMLYFRNSSGNLSFSQLGQECNLSHEHLTLSAGSLTYPRPLWKEQHSRHLWPNR